MKGFSEERLKKLFTDASAAKESGISLSGVFAKFSKENKLAKGTVRNLYYEYLKRFESDEALKQKFLGKSDLRAEKIVEFDKIEARWLLKKILVGATLGKPVRKIVLGMTGDAKKALRYQNKYRNMLKNDRALVEEVSAEIKSELGKCFDPYGKRREDVVLERLKCEINDLYSKIAKSARDENLRLKTRVEYLENENAKLKSALDYSGR